VGIFRVSVFAVSLFYLNFIDAKIAEKCTDTFARNIVAGSIVMVFAHVGVNIGMVTGILPVVGVTLPFMSYGGSSLIVQMIGIGFCANATIWRKST
jgi:cell division protein FtsW (lipid II flippase)